MAKEPFFKRNPEAASEAGSKSKRGQAPEKKLLAEAIQKQITYDEAATILIQMARSGNIKALEMILDRTAGKSTNEIDIIGNLTTENKFIIED